jgi:hypothetical protein
MLRDLTVQIMLLLHILPAEKVAFQPLLLCKASVMNLINISPLEAVSVIRGDALNVKPLLGCRRNPLVVAPS